MYDVSTITTATTRKQNEKVAAFFLSLREVRFLSLSFFILSLLRVCTIVSEWIHVFVCLKVLPQMKSMTFINGSLKTEVFTFVVKISTVNLIRKIWFICWPFFSSTYNSLLKKKKEKNEEKPAAQDKWWSLRYKGKEF